MRRIRIDDRRRSFPDLRELLRYRELIVLLGRRDITVRYRQTILGTTWIFAGPIVSAGLFSFVFGRIASLPSGGVSYFVFSYAGLLTWNVFLNTLNGASSSLTGNSALITKIYFPRLVIPISALASVVINATISFGVMLVLIVFGDVGTNWHIVFLPVWLVLASVLAMGIGLLIAATSVWYRDVNYLTPLLTQLLLFLSPVAYSVAAVPADIRNLYLLNPLATLLELTRWSLLGESYVPPTWAIAYSVGWCLVAILLGVHIFTRRERGFADVV